MKINSSSKITFDLSQDKWMSLLRALAPFKLPVTQEYKLNHIPADSEFVRMFVSNISKDQKEFTFNHFSLSQLDSSKYIKELKCVAANSIDEFYIKNSTFSVIDFCELVVSARNIDKLYICYSTIPLDDKFDISEQLDHCQISYLNMAGCGNADQSDWQSFPQRFDNLMEAISKCAALKNSLKILSITDCGVTKEKAEEILKKYDLNELKVEGI